MSTPSRTQRTPLSLKALSIVILFSLILAALPIPFISVAPSAEAASSNIVISQIYGAGGNSGATYKNDFIELFNRGAAPASVNGWSVQYTSATGTGNFGSATNLITPLPNVSIPAGGYLLIYGAGGTNGANLPVANDVTDATPIDMSGTSGKVALVNTTTPLGCNGGSNPCSASALANIVDLIGYGGANFFEGAAAPTLTATTADFRDDAGCVDTDNNSADFSSAAAPVSPGTPSPRNSGSSPHVCGVVANNPPTINAPANPIATVNQGAAPFNVNLTGSDDGGIYNWSATPGTGISSVVVFAGQGTNNVTYKVTLQSSFSGTATFTASLSDNVNAPATQLVNIQVQPTVVNNPPTITAPPNPITTVNQDAAPFTVNLSGSDDNNIYNWSATPGTGVSAVSVTAGQGTANVTYTVTLQSGFSGTATFTASLSDNVNAAVTRPVNITVTPAPAANVVLSQVYGGGGNTGSTLKNDFIELINHGSVPVSLNGWSVQVFSTTLNAWEVTPLTNFTLQPGQYYLIQESQGAGGTDNLPTPDAVGGILVSSTASKVALVSNTTTLTGACPTGSGIVDFVGYGTATTCFEGAGPAPQLSNTTAALRRNEGCFDTDDNAADFVSGGPNPRNSSSPVHDCTGLSAYGSANPNTVPQGSSTTLTVTVAPAQNPDSIGITVTGDLSSIGGSSSQSFTGSGNVFTFVATVPANNPPGMKSLPVSVADGQGRTTSTSILVSVLSTTPDHVTISQVYGGGGNAGATYANDYVELYNPTAAPISMTGWSLQYGPATGTTFTGKTVLGGSIDPGHYYLISLASGGSNGASLPSASVTGDINMAAGAGKIVLVSNSDTLIGQCPVGSDPDIVDFVGYGTTANCHEGSANTPAPGNTTAIFRKSNGGTDTDQNGNDFLTGVPNPRSTTPVVEFGPSVAGTDPSTNSITAPYDSTITVDFSEPVDAVGTWYNISCANTGLHSDVTFAHSADFKTWAVTPNTSFQFGEQCTVTINKNQIHDRDSDDSNPDTDTLSADYVWSFTVVSAGQAAPYPPSVHLTMGNPSNATASVSNPDNYLMEKPTYSLSYNRDKGTPNWVSWHLDNSWYGTLTRVDTFRPDPAVDPSWYRVQAFDYSSSGFDRGHMTPNADRDNQNRVPINQETYLMSNMVPQAPDNNQGPWANLEAYLRTQADAGNEIYIVSGPAGIGGAGSNGSATTIANGHVTVPAQTWKVALIIPKAEGDDISRVTCGTRTLAVIMPNIQGIRNDDWQNYITTVDAVEQLTGYDFFSNVPEGIQTCIEAGTNGSNPPGASDGAYTTAEDTPVNVTMTALPSGPGTLTYTVVTPPAHGTLSGTGANRVYTPSQDFNGTDAFTFSVSDGTRTSRTATVSLLVTEVNDAPVTMADNKSTAEDTPLIFAAGDLTTNDNAGPANESGQTLTVNSVEAGPNTHGSVTLNIGQVTYEPEANYHGPASFTYTVCDNGSPSSQCSPGTVNVTVNSVNDNPVAGDDTATTDEDTAVTIQVTANDSDVDGDSVSLASASNGAHGTTAISGNNIVYTPASNFNGSDSFTYTVSDGQGGTATATVQVTINTVNDAPVATPDNASTDEDTPTTINVVGNDTDVDGDALTLESVGVAQNGTVAIDNNQAVYTPAGNYHGPDSFTYVVKDTHGATSESTVSITVNSVNDNPVVVNDSATTNEDTSVIIDVVGNDTDVDGDSLTLASVNGATNGTVSIVDGKAVFSPNADYHGAGSFSYVVSDGHGGTANGNVTVTINSVNDNPVANVDSASTNEDTAVTVDVRANDTDVDGDGLSIASVTNGAHGTVTIVDGSAVYTPAANYNGTDSFTYTVSDGQGGTASTTVNVTINPVNDAPVLSNVPASASLNELAAYSFQATASDVDGQTLTFSLVGAPAGAVIDPNTGQFSWTPTEAQGNTGGVPYSFKVRVSDGVTTTDSDITLTVNEVNQNPTLNPIGNQTVYLGGALSFTAVGADSDLPTQTLSYSLTGAVPAGASINSSTGVFSWLPTTAQVGAVYTFNVRVTDSLGGYAEQPVSIGVAYSWSGLLAPVQDGGVYKIGRTLPIKFRLTGASAGITNAVARLWVAKISNGVAGQEIEADTTGAANTDNLFRYDGDGQYIFNWSVRDYTEGTYQLRIDLGDGVQRIITIGLK